ncbi:hypothetical protein [Methylobacterium sp. C25]|nr:hypothetical protein [Methylobacterium sp. C25]
MAQTEKQAPNDVVNALLADRLTNDGFLPYVECPPEVAAKGEYE